jgi:hypothetical protein
LAGHAERATMLDVVGADGERVIQSQLPPPGLKRCSVRQRLAVVAAVRHGLLTIAEARERYDLSLDEFLAWHVAFDEDWPLVGDRDRLQ